MAVAVAVAGVTTMLGAAGAAAAVAGATMMSEDAVKLPDSAGIVVFPGPTGRCDRWRGLCTARFALRLKVTQNPRRE